MGWKTMTGVLLMGVACLAEGTNQFKTLAKGAFGGIQQPLQVVITNKTQWAELWGKHAAQTLPREAPPEVDFSKESVIFVTAGRKNTGGYSTEITEVRRSGDETEVTVANKEPRPGGLNIQALTAPFHIVAVPRIEGKVKFKTAENKKGG